uniref:Uncharacterized protein n=1 Tax=Zea mays TaxID=4577 RepID=A0A804LZV6_MAIZE
MAFELASSRPSAVPGSALLAASSGARSLARVAPAPARAHLPAHPASRARAASSSLTPARPCARLSDAQRRPPLFPSNTLQLLPLLARPTAPSSMARISRPSSSLPSSSPGLWPSSLRTACPSSRSSLAAFISLRVLSGAAVPQLGLCPFLSRALLQSLTHRTLHARICLFRGCALPSLSMVRPHLYFSAGRRFSSRGSPCVPRPAP